jgi:hypothetical protein
MRMTHEEKMKVYQDLHHFAKTGLKYDDDYTSCMDEDIIKELAVRAYWRPLYNKESYLTALECIEMMLENYPKQVSEIMLHQVRLTITEVN